MRRSERPVLGAMAARARRGARPPSRGCQRGEMAPAAGSGAVRGRGAGTAGQGQRGLRRQRERSGGNKGGIEPTGSGRQSAHE